MFGLDGTIIAFIALATMATGGVIYTLLFNSVSNEVRQEKRVKSIQSRKDVGRIKAAARVAEVAKRKQSVQDSLKELEAKQRERHGKTLTLKKQLRQAGLSINVRQFWMISVAFGLGVGVLLVVLGMPPVVAGAGAVVGMLGLPRWVVGRMRNRRMNAFLKEFPNAVDVIVRGVKAGLPLNDCLGIIAREAKEPVRGEFAAIIESQNAGLPLSESVQRLYENMPLAESNFFGIVIAIQQSAGGNLSEALGNLANVLRDRKKMKMKIQAMSMEAKASGAIIGALPFIVALLVYITTPDYIMLLFTESTGHMILAGSGLWMSIGILVMKKMINFDF